VTLAGSQPDSCWFDSSPTTTKEIKAAVSKLCSFNLVLHSVYYAENS
jgi:hypothetical protein